jgi:uncharacterized membrane protein
MGTSFAIPIVLLILVGLALGSLLNFAAAFLAIPIVAIIMIGLVMTSDITQRQRRIHKMRQFRHSARAQKAGLSDDDKYTVV